MKTLSCSGMLLFLKTFHNIVAILVGPRVRDGPYPRLVTYLAEICNVFERAGNKNRRQV
jgi:hypothetical protein